MVVSLTGADWVLPATCWTGLLHCNRSVCGMWFAWQRITMVTAKVWLKLLKAVKRTLNQGHRIGTVLQVQKLTMQVLGCGESRYWSGLYLYHAYCGGCWCSADHRHYGSCFCIVQTEYSTDCRWRYPLYRWYGKALAAGANLVMMGSVLPVQKKVLVKPLFTKAEIQTIPRYGIYRCHEPGKGGSPFPGRGRWCKEIWNSKVLKAALPL